jgi:hypothetical protein
MPATVLAVAAGPEHGPGKPPQPAIRLLAGLGVAGDAHCGATVQHRSRAARFPDRINLRQVHLIHAELYDLLAARGFALDRLALGENVVTQGVDLLALPTGTRLALGAAAVVELTGLRNPCSQLDALAPGLMNALLDRDAAGGLVRLAGVMAIVVTGGEVRPDDAVAVTLPAPPHVPLAPV